VVHGRTAEELPARLIWEPREAKVSMLVERGSQSGERSRKKEKRGGIEMRRGTVGSGSVGNN
jgi:hypothetical protein